MLRINQIKLKCGESVKFLPSKIGKTLRIKDFKPEYWNIVKESTDARHKPDITFIYTVDFSLKDKKAEEALLAKSSRIKGVKLERVIPYKYQMPELGTCWQAVKGGAGQGPMASVEAKGKAASDCKRPVVVGFGPCGMFAALILAEAGLKPIVLERGRRVEDRTLDVERFWATGQLDTESNVQYGEGGAGTFSDGKLTTGTKDARFGKVNAEFIEAGADPSIAYKQMPHIGTDVLRVVVKNIREKIISLGGEVRFESKVTGICEMENAKVNKLSGLIINGTDRLECSHAIFALGNSARDTFEMLYKNGIKMEAKPFSVGVRIEHPQLLINESQYGVEANDTEGRLGAAAYKLSHHCEDGRGVYTFCMCPGGQVVGAASEENGVVTNGMSYFARDGKNANSALLVGVSPEDYAGYVNELKSATEGEASESQNDAPHAPLTEVHPLAGIEFQRHLESLAYQAGGGGYFAPAQRLRDFLGQNADDSQNNNSNASGTNASEAHAYPAVEPTYRPGVTWTDIDLCLPAFVTAAMREALPAMARRIKGFDLGDAVITGVETRSSSPLRIPRSDQGQSVSLAGLYPAGEGAGYAGGIMSAAADGIRIAEMVITGAL